MLRLARELKMPLAEVVKLSDAECQLWFELFAVEDAEMKKQAAKMNAKK